jgi:hypothetical protein
MALKGERFPRLVFEKRVTLKLPLGMNNKKKGNAITTAAPALRSFAIAGDIAPSRVDGGTSVIYVFAVDVAILVVGRGLSPLMFFSHCRDTYGPHK